LRVARKVVQARGELDGQAMLDVVEDAFHLPGTPIGRRYLGCGKSLADPSRAASQPAVPVTEGVAPTSSRVDRVSISRDAPAPGC
jgi:hypothetical protein